MSDRATFELNGSSGQPYPDQDPEEEAEEGFEGKADVTMGTSACSRITLESKAGIETVISSSSKPRPWEPPRAITLPWKVRLGL